MTTRFRCELRDEKRDSESAYDWHQNDQYSPGTWRRKVVGIVTH